MGNYLEVSKFLLLPTHSLLVQTRGEVAHLPDTCTDCEVLDSFSTQYNYMGSRHRSATLVCVLNKARYRVQRPDVN